MPSQSHDRDTDQPCLLVYDGDCRLCVAVKHKLEQVGVSQAGHPIRFVAYQSDEAKEVLGTQYSPERPDMAFFVRPSGDIRQGLEAFLPFVSGLPAGRLLLWCLRFSCAKRFAEGVYRFIARYRYRLFGAAVKPSG